MTVCSPPPRPLIRIAAASSIILALSLLRPVDAASRTLPPNNGTHMRQCLCTESTACRDAAMASLTSSIESCGSDLQSFADLATPKRDVSFLYSCFEQNSQVVPEAEKCLTRKLGQFCEPRPRSTQMYPRIHIADFSTKFQPIEADDTLPQVFEKEHQNYNKLHLFLHCVRRSIAQKIVDCQNSLGCSLRLPPPDQFTSAFQECAHNSRATITQLQMACYCLVSQKLVIPLSTLCGLIGTHNFQ